MTYLRVRSDVSARPHVRDPRGMERCDHDAADVDHRLVAGDLTGIGPAGRNWPLTISHDPAIDGAWATVVIGSFFLCRRTLTGTAIGQPPQGGSTTMVSTTRFSPRARPRRYPHQRPLAARRPRDDRRVAGVPISRIAAQTRHKDLGVLVNRYIRPLEAPAITSSKDLGL